MAKPNGARIWVLLSSIFGFYCLQSVYSSFSTTTVIDLLVKGQQLVEAFPEVA